jgi:hypothetical protein
MYIVLSIFCLISFLIFGYLVSIRKGGGKYRFNYWRLAIPPIVLYCITYGFRYAWGTDYFSYKSLYEVGFTGNTKTIESIEYFFKLINEVLHLFNAPFYFAFFTYSFLFIFGVFFLLKSHRQIVFIALPIFYFMTAYQSSNLVRNCISIGFLYISISYLLKNKWKPFVIVFISSFLTHSSVIFYFPIMIILKYYDIFKNLWLILILYCISYFISSLDIGEFLTIAIESTRFFFTGEISNFIKFGSYFDSTQHFHYISGENVIGKLADIRFIQLIFFTLIDIVIIYYGFGLKKLKKYVNFGYFYNLTILGIIFYRPLYGFELPMRLNFFYWWFLFIVIPYILYDMYKTKKFLILVIFATLLLLSFDFGPHTIIRVDKLPAIYFWDK